MVELRPMTQKAAKEWVKKTHRHLPRPPHGDLFRVALYVNRRLVAVGMAGRPSARLLQDGRTVEITRIASRARSRVNACSRLYGALIRAGQALGYRRFITYTLEDEPGISPTAANFEFDGMTSTHDRIWTHSTGPRAKTLCEGPKQRWLYPSRSSGLWKSLKPGVKNV